MDHPETVEANAQSSAPAPSVDRLVVATENFARQEPLRAVGAAFGSGLLLTLLPIGSIVSGILRLALALVRPFLIILGVVKLYEQLGETSPDTASAPADGDASPEGNSSESHRA
jgi:hypothetical protein